MTKFSYFSFYNFTIISSKWHHQFLVIIRHFDDWKTEYDVWVTSYLWKFNDVTSWRFEVLTILSPKRRHTPILLGNFNCVELTKRWRNLTLLINIVTIISSKVRQFLAIIRHIHDWKLEYDRLINDVFRFWLWRHILI